MALSVCDVSIDNNGRELLEHGSSAFPIACYHDNLREHSVPWHWHEELEAAIITEGCAVVAAGTQKYTIYAGEGFFINTGILHGAWDIDCSCCRFHSIVFHPRIIGGHTDSVFYQKYVLPIINNIAVESLFLSPNISWQKRMLIAIENTWQSCVNEPLGYEFTVRNELSEFVLQLHCNTDTPPIDADHKAMRNNIRIKQMLQFIHNHYNEELTISLIAASASIGNSECLRCFKTMIGITPIQYVKQYRLQRACQLLSSTEKTIQDISYACGFNDLSYFTKVFREEKGITPGEYRRNFHSKKKGLEV